MSNHILQAQATDASYIDDDVLLQVARFRKNAVRFIAERINWRI